MKTIITIFGLMLIAASTFAQEKAIKLSQFDSREKVPSDFSRVSEMADGFVKRIAAEPTAEGVVIIVHSRTEDDTCYTGEIVANKAIETAVRRRIDRAPSTVRKRIAFLSGEISLTDRVQFWLVPKGARPPDHTDQFTTDFSCCCATFAIIGPKNLPRGSRYVDLTVTIKPPKLRLKFNWTVSAGKIVSGQGTHKIRIDTKGVSKDIEVDVETSGASPICACPTTASHRISIRQ